MVNAVDAEFGVIGLGAMGTAALWQLAARGASAIGFEQYVPGHDRGSSHGDTRIIRTAYFEDPRYVPLVQEAFAMWRELQAETGTALLVETGGLMIGRPDAEVVSGALASARQHHLSHEVLDASQLRQRYPQHVVDSGEVAVLEPDAGYLRPELAVRAMAARATALGARLEAGSRIVAIEPGRDSVVVRTATASWQVGRLVVTAGAWTAALLPALSPILSVERNVMGWFAVRRPENFTPGAFPIFIHDLGARPAVYGFPTTDGRSIKLAVHRRGAPADPMTLDRAIHPGDVAPCVPTFPTTSRGRHRARRCDRLHVHEHAR